MNKTFESEKSITVVTVNKIKEKNHEFRKIPKGT